LKIRDKKYKEVSGGSMALDLKQIIKGFYEQLEKLKEYL